MNKKKIVIIFIALLILITGCSKNARKSASSTSVKGRYVETKVSLPDGISKYTSLQLTKKDNMPFLYTFTYGNQCTISGYQMNSDGTWTEKTPEWLKSRSIANKSLYQCSIFEDSNENQYLFYTDVANSNKAALLRSTDGTTYETLNPEGWDDVDPDFNICIAPDKFAVLGDGTLVALLSDNEVAFYNSDTLKKEYRITDTRYCNSILSVLDHAVILGQEDNTGKITSIDVYDTTNNYKKTSYPFQSTIAKNVPSSLLQASGNAFLDVNNKNNYIQEYDYILCNPDGVHVLEQGTHLWQTVIDGTLISLSKPTMTNCGFLKASDENYYILYNSENDGYSLMQYTYDKTIDSVPSTELTVYSLKDSSTLRQAAAVFQQSHPDVKINFNIAMTDEEYEAADITTKEDYIRALNTELLAGSGPDILVLDGLPADSFIEKGVLADISNTVKPMIKKEEVFSNIINNYITDDKIYYVPARFSLKLLCGTSSKVESLSTLESLANYMANHKDKMGNMTLDYFINTFSPYLTKKILDSNGKIDKENLVSILNKLKAIADNCSIIDDPDQIDEFRDQNGIITTVYNLANNRQLSMDSCYGFDSAMKIIGTVFHVNGSYTSFENSFIPNCELGINNASTHKNLCQDFINLVLSEEVLKNNFNDGFPINIQSVINNSKTARSASDALVGFNTEHGNYSFKIKPLTEKQVEDLINICSNVSNRAICDDQIMKAFQEETTDFFKGNLSADQTADQIIEKTNVYLSE